MSEGMSKDMSEKMSQDMSGIMSEDTAKTAQWVGESSLSPL